MKQLLLISLLCIASLQALATTLRCEHGIADKGDRTSEVQQKCGTPVSQAVTGHTLDRNGKVQYVKEEWVYSRENGMLYFLQFEGERLVRVDSKRGG
ncbi:DUF2845 domain-containing protein [Pseudomonas sp. CAU 1711]|uniref:DUF2845 domain-containing protein n=1 Tax=Pseudomonas sp. CAU 1711 TaxID=3140356 RepID=UPI0032612909